MIVLDTTVLVYAVGMDHPHRAACRRVVEAVSRGEVEATTTVEVIQEFVHVRARRRDHTDAVALGAAYADLLAPLLPVTSADLHAGLALYGHSARLGAFDAVLAATAIRRQADALLSADTAFGQVPGLVHLFPDDDAVARVLGDAGS